MSTGTTTIRPDEGLDARQNSLPGPVQQSDYRIFTVVDYVSWVGIVAHALFVPLFYWLGVAPMALFNVASVACWVAARQANRRGRHILATALITLEVVLHAMLAVTYLGWHSGFQYYLIPLVPFLMFNARLTSRTVLLSSVMVFAIFVMLFRLVGQDGALVRVDPAVLGALTYANAAVPFLALGLISFFFRQTSATIERRMEQLASTDELTGLFNRRVMYRRFEEQRTVHAPHDAPFSIILADIDHFKHINDTHGHVCGDVILQHVASMLSSQLRGEDVVARWGGEEFLILLPGTDAQGAKTVAEKLRAHIRSQSFEGCPPDLRITMTCGVSEFAGEGTTFDDCIRRADAALYQGKHEGRDRVVTATS